MKWIRQAEHDGGIFLEKIFPHAVIGEFFSYGNISDAEPLKNLCEHFITLGVVVERIRQAEHDGGIFFEKIFPCAVIGEFFSYGNISDAEPLKNLCEHFITLG